MKNGLREAHAHIAQHGRAMAMERMEACGSRQEVLERVARACARLAPGRWVLGDGMRLEGWREPVWPTATELDDAAGARPVCLWSFDYHALVVNSAAMRAIGVGDGTPDPEHGRIERDERGDATGVMIEGAAKLAWSRVPEPNAEEKREQVLAAARDLARHGFVEVHELLAPVWLGPVLAGLDDAGELPVRVLVYPRYEEMDRVLPEAAAWQRERVVLAGAKMFADGTLNSRTASMLEPYADPRGGMACGDAMLSREELADAMRRMAALGLGLAVHAIGDRAVRTVLDAWEGVRGEVKGGLGGGGGNMARRAMPRVRIEHAEMIDRADVARFAELGVVCSVQPCHLLADIEALRRGLPHRLDRVFPLRELIDSGCRPGELLWFGSDTPIVRPDPEDSIRAAVHRRREGAAEREAIAPEQAISEREAWACFAAPS